MLTYICRVIGITETIMLIVLVSMMERFWRLLNLLPAISSRLLSMSSSVCKLANEQLISV